MLIIIVAGLAIGLVKRQGVRYWGHLALAVVLFLALDVLFRADTGVASPAMKRLLGDGTAYVLTGLAAVLGGWLAVFVIVKRGYRPRSSGSHSAASSVRP